MLTSIMMSSGKKESFAQYVRRNRVATDLTQGALAQAAGISQSYVSGIERGVNIQVDPDIVHALADALKVDSGEALRVASADVGYTHQETIRESVIDLSAFEGYEELDDEAREDVVDDVALAVERARKKQRRRESIGSKHLE